MGVYMCCSSSINIYLIYSTYQQKPKCKDIQGYDGYKETLQQTANCACPKASQENNPELPEATSILTPHRY